VVQSDHGGITHEIVRRSPGVRLIIVDGDRILMTKEFRKEHGVVDYRLPGGKVFDTLAEYMQKGRIENIMAYTEEAAKNECRQETGLLATSLRHFATSKSGATVEWDLYYFIVDQFEQNPNGQELEHGEDITVEWKTRDEVKTLCLDGSIKEDRTVGVLLKYLLA
ncbi:MAG: NUDIX domain-containing protein, partial [Patescibacteria group bacterium]